MDFRGKNIDLVSRWKLWFGISAVAILIGIVSLGVFGLNLGIDFKGGGQLQYRIPAAARPQGGQEAALLDAVRSGLDEKGITGSKIQVAGGDTLVIQTSAATSSELDGQKRAVQEVLAKEFKADAKSVTPIGQQLVGAVIGEELQRDAIKGVTLGVLCIALWIYIRYNFAGDGTRYAVAGIVALLHDVFVLVGIFSLIGHFDPRVEIDASFIAALLTVVGYSINDSVVIFDRIRENLRQRRKEPFNKIVNDSLLETMSRSINTGLTVIMMLVVLVLFGGESIYSFVLAMLIGIASGLYSSIFNASMVLVAWDIWEEKKKLQGRASRPTARSTSPSRAVSASTSSPGAGSSAARGGLAAASLASGTASTAPSTPSLSKTGTDETLSMSGSTPEPGELDEAESEAEAENRAVRTSQKARSKKRF